MEQVQALVVNHGSFITDEDIEKIKQPSLFNGADNDQHISKERFRKIEETLKGNKVPTDFKASWILSLRCISELSVFM